MEDGCRLAARIWLPEEAPTTPVPAIIEYLPYRKRAGTRERDEPMHRYFAGHGYAAIRIDLRGSGESDGLLMDEYLEQEQLDGIQAIRWIAEQPWCNGAVGMMGVSWGGFNALQVAACRPPELRAIISVCSSDDRYADDAHFMGGCLLSENLIWGSVLFTLNAQPPDPDLVGNRWRDMWLQRLENSILFPEIWLQHQRRDEYWRHGSIREDYSRISCPVYAVGGWADGYSNAVPRLLAGLRAPRKGLVGPWGHLYPHLGTPGPAIGFLQEALRWWDQWLKGMDTGIMREPIYRVWMQESVPPGVSFRERPGRWVAESQWPSPRIRLRRLEINPGSLDPVPDPPASMFIASPQDVGLAAGSWCGFGLEGELPGDQREDDGKSLCFDSPPLNETLEILGAPQATLVLAVNRPRGFLAVRLNDVAPDGSSARISYGLLNLCHRQDHENPLPLKPGEPVRVTIRLNDIAHAFPPGHRLRLAISTSYWPLVWPSPEPVNLTLFTEGSHLHLPERPPLRKDAELRSFPPAEGAPGPPQTEITPGPAQRTVERDLVSGEVRHVISTDIEPRRGPAIWRMEDIGLELGHGIIETFRIRGDSPLSAEAEIVQNTVTRREGWEVKVNTRLQCSADADFFFLMAEIEALEGGKTVFRRHWDRRIPRDFT